MEKAIYSDVPLDLLKTLVVFSDSGGVDEASRRLNLTQAAVSLQLQRLEKALDRSLFHSAGRRKVLTEFARDLCQQIAPPLSLIDQKLTEVCRSKTPSVVARRWRIGCVESYAPSVLKNLKMNGQKTISTGIATDLLKLLSEGQLDFVVCDANQSFHRWETKKIGSDAFQFIGAVKDEQTPPETVPEWKAFFQQLDENKAVINDVDPEPMHQIFQKMGLHSVKTQELNSTGSWSLMRTMVESCRGWSVVPSNFGFADKKWTIPKDLVSHREYQMLGLHETHIVASV